MLQPVVTEKRISSRVNLMVPVSVYSKGQFLGFTFSKNISLGGMLLANTNLDLRDSARIELDIHIQFDDKLKKSRIPVVLKRIEANGVTVEFEHISTSSVIFIRQFLV